MLCLLICQLVNPECWASIKDYQMPFLCQLNQEKISRNMIFSQKDKKLVSSAIEDLLKKVSANKTVFEQYILVKE